MRRITEFLSTKVAKSSIIKATDKTIYKIVKAELDRLGHDADLNHIDVSGVTTMDQLFSTNRSGTYDLGLGDNYFDLNPDISRWDVSNVVDMKRCFWFCSQFNCDLSQWNTDSLKFADYAFCQCTIFNQDMSTWNMSNCESIRGMFAHCFNFKSDLSGWDVRKVKDMTFFLTNCQKFCCDLSGWELDSMNNGIYSYEGCLSMKDKYWPSKRKNKYK